MSLQICPNCKEYSITWYMDEDESSLTIWFCSSCNYKAFEDETKERYCFKCKRKTELHMKDSKNEYWWCSNCNSTKAIEVTS